MKMRSVIFVFLLLIFSTGRAQAEGGLPRVATPALKMTGLQVQSMRQSKIMTPALKMTGMQVQSMRNSKIMTPALKMTGLQVQSMRNSKITTPALKMTGLQVQSMRQSKITTPALKMTGMQYSDYSRGSFGRDVAMPSGSRAFMDTVDPNRPSQRPPAQDVLNGSLSNPSGVNPKRAKENVIK